MDMSITKFNVKRLMITQLITTYKSSVIRKEKRLNGQCKNAVKQKGTTKQPYKLSETRTDQCSKN